MASARYRGRMIVNDTDYTGSFVDPNPSGTATDTLQKVDIDGVIYDIQGGGSSGGAAYTETVLWNTPTSTSSWSNPVIMTLNDNITNYHELKVVFSNQSGETYGYITIPVSEVLAHNYTQYFSNDAISGTSNYVLVSSINEIKCYPKDSGTTTYYVKVIGIKYGGNLSPIIYSTEEREVGVWIDNKPLYQKTLVFENYTNGTYQDVSSLNIEEVVNNFGEHRLADYSYGLSFPYYENNNWYSLMTFDKNNGRYYVYCSSQMADTYKKLFITIQYTKTTDVAGSGEYNTLGVPNVHYDSNEKIIGTWFGETLYERTLNIGSMSSAKDGYVIGDKATLKIKDCVELYGKCTYETNGEKQTIALPNYNTSTYYIRIYYESDLGIILDIPSLNGKAGIWFEYSNEAFQYYNNDIYITIRYTKTTD